MERKRNGLLAGLLIFCVLSVSLHLWQLRRISTLEERLSNAQNAVMNNVSALSRQVYALSSQLEERERLALDWGLEPSGIDRASGSLLMEVFLTLKEWQADTEVWLIARQGSHTNTVYLENTGTGRFSGELPVALTAVGETFQLEARIGSGGVNRQEELGAWDDTSQLLPLQNSGDRYGGPGYQNGVFTLDDYTVFLSDQDGDPARAEEPVFSLERGGKTLWQGRGTVTEDQGYSAGGTVEVPCEAGGRVELCFTCRDEYGLKYRFSLESWEIGQDGWISSTAPGASPVLSWE